MQLHDPPPFPQAQTQAPQFPNAQIVPSPAPRSGGGGGPQGLIPPQGFRIQADTEAAFPLADRSGAPPFRDLGGEPVYVGSSINGNNAESVHPCKIVPHLAPPCRVAYGGIEQEHWGRYDLLPITEDMEWVLASNGQIPHGRRPIDGGYEEAGQRLYHAVAVIQGVSVPGKTGEHLGACHVAFGGSEHVVKSDYWILCWREY